MKSNLFYNKCILVASAIFLISLNALGQDAHSSVKINILNVNLSSDSKTISYDVYFQNIDATKQVGMMGYTFRAKVTQASIGSTAKSCSISNVDPTLGAASNTISSSDAGTNWTMKFTLENPIYTWARAKILSSNYPGTKIATYSITNTDGSLFSNPQCFELAWVGTAPIVKTTASIYLEGTQKLAPNSTTNMPESQFSGFGTYSLKSSNKELYNPKSGIISLSPNPAIEGFYINMGNNAYMLSIFDVNGRKIVSQQIAGDSYVNVSHLAKGIYLVDVNDTQTKLVKK